MVPEPQVVVPLHLGQGAAVDPNFGGNTADAPGNLAGWYNSNPPSLLGKVHPNEGGPLSGYGGYSAMIGRFSVLGGGCPESPTLTLVGTRGRVAWNQGLETPANFKDWAVSERITVAGASPALIAFGDAAYRGVARGSTCDDGFLVTIRRNGATSSPARRSSAPRRFRLPSRDERSPRRLSGLQQPTRR